MEDEMMFGDEAQKDSFELDENVVNEINNDRFEGEKLSNEEMTDALLAVDVIADTVIGMQGGEHTEIDPEKVLNQVEEIVTGGDEGFANSINDNKEPGANDEDNLPSELENSVVRVQVAEDGADIGVETTDVHNDIADGELCTVCETPQLLTADEFPLQESCDKEKLQNAKLLTIGNSKSTKFRKGYFVLTSATKKKNKRAWSSAYKTVRKLIGSRRMTAADWVIVSYIASCKMKTLTSSVKKILSAFKGSENLKKIFISNAKKPLNSDLNAQGNSELDENGQPKNQMEPENKNLGSETGNVNENATTQAAQQGGEHTENYGTVPQPTNEKTPQTTITAPELDYAELSAPINNSMQGLVMRKLSEGIYRVVGTRVSSAKEISFNKINRPERGSVKNSCPFKSGSVVMLGNGKAILLKNSNTAGMLAFYGDFVKSAKAAVPYFASQEKGKGIVIAESKKGEDIFARGEKIYSDFKFAEMKASAEKEIRASLEKDYEVRRKQIQSAMEAKYNRQINSNNEASKKLEDMVRDKERQRLFSANQKAVNEDAEITQILSSQNVDRMASLMGRI